MNCAISDCTILCKQSDKALVDLTLPENANIYAQEYKLYLPEKNCFKTSCRSGLHRKRIRIKEGEKMEAKKLIEVALPLDKINEASAREIT